MNVNNEMFRMFKEMKQGYQNKNPGQMEHGARCWLDLNPENPFPEESPEFEAFFQMHKCYMIWKRGDVDRKINYHRMITWAETLCKLNPKQPYEFDKEADKIEKQIKFEEELLQAKKKEEEQAKAIQRQAQLIVEEEERAKKEKAEKEKAKQQQEKEQQEKIEKDRAALLLAIKEERKKIEGNSEEDTSKYNMVETKDGLVLLNTPVKESFFKKLLKKVRRHDSTGTN